MSSLNTVVAGEAGVAGVADVAGMARVAGRARSALNTVVAGVAGVAYTQHHSITPHTVFPIVVVVLLHHLDSALSMS